MLYARGEERLALACSVRVAARAVGTTAYDGHVPNAQFYMEVFPWGDRAENLWENFYWGRMVPHKIWGRSRRYSRSYSLFNLISQIGEKF